MWQYFAFSVTKKEPIWAKIEYFEQKMEARAGTKMKIKNIG